jgi:hypothetical protein
MFEKEKRRRKINLIKLYRGLPIDSKTFNSTDIYSFGYIILHLNKE